MEAQQGGIRVIASELDDTSLDEVLEHYGIKGMKWGVRRSQAELDRAAGRKPTRSEKKDAKDLAKGRATKSERKEARKNLKEEAYGPGKAMDRRWDRFSNQTGIGAKPYSELSTERRTIAAGEKFYRTSGVADESVPRTANEIRYVSRTEADRVRYNAVLPRFTLKSGLKDVVPSYEHTLKTTQKLTLPSEKDRIDAFAELMDTKSIEIGRKTYTGRELLKRSGYKKQVKQLDNTALGQQFFSQMQDQAWMNRGISDAYFQNLRKKGFNAVIDDNDIGVLSDDPIILLNPNGTVKSMQVKQLSSRDVTAAMANFKGDLEERR
jgi:hypothetical protein